MRVRGRGCPAGPVPIRPWVAVLDRCLATVALVALALVTTLLGRGRQRAAEFCPNE